ncbi:MAG TPA: ACT domain-containing protein, partial [Acidimicrobiales bacterium]
DTSTATAHDYVNLISIRGGTHAIAGTLVGLRGEPRVVMLDDNTIDLPPAKHMLVVRNDDRPGMIAFVAGVLAEAKVNIDDMHLGRSERGEAAIQVLATDVSVPPEVQDLIRKGDGIVEVHALT